MFSKVFTKIWFFFLNFRVTFVISKSGEEITVKGKEGDSIYDAIVENNIVIPGYGKCKLLFKLILTEIH